MTAEEMRHKLEDAKVKIKFLRKLYMDMALRTTVDAIDDVADVLGGLVDTINDPAAEDGGIA